MEFIVILRQILLLFAIAGVGAIAFLTGLMSESGNKSITKLLLHITLPGMILASVAEVPKDFTAMDILIILGISFLSYVIMGIIAFAAPRFFPGTKENRGLYEFLILFGNVGFMGFPIVAALFGSSAIFIAALCNLPMNILCFTIGILMIAPKGTKLKVTTILTPAVIASVIAPLLFLLPFSLPDEVYKVFSLLGQPTIPLAMLLVGASVANAIKKKQGFTPRLFLTSFLRLILCPLGVYLLLRPFVDNSLYLSIITVLAAMPSATNATLLCIEYGGDELCSSQGVCLSTLFSAITIPLMIFLLLS